MLDKTRHFVLQVVGGCNVASVAMMLATGYAGCLEPSSFPLLAVSGLAFPVFLVINVLFIPLWMVLKFRYVAISVVGLLLSLDLLMDYAPINIAEEHPKGSIKVLSYNVMGFNHSAVPKGEKNEILQYIIDSGADIVCIQEHHPGENYQPEQWKELHEIYAYIDTIRTPFDGDTMALMSKFPITGKRRIDFVSKGNLAGAFEILIDGKKVNVINCHLETVGFSAEDKQNFERMVKGNTDRQETKSGSRLLLSKLMASMEIRAPQARVVTDYVAQRKGESVILCGDFNDHPLSYVHRTIADGLTDCFRATGNLPGFSFNYGSMFVRIDNIMCSHDWTPYECTVDRANKLSDHYPIYCYLHK